MFLQRAMAMKNHKHPKDLELLVEKIGSLQYANYGKMKRENAVIIGKEKVKFFLKN